LTPLNLLHLKVFLNFFWEFFIFLIQIWILNLGRFGTGPNQNRAGPVWPVTGEIRPVPTGLVNSGTSSPARAHGNDAARKRRNKKRYCGATVDGMCWLSWNLLRRTKQLATESRPGEAHVLPVKWNALMLCVRMLRTCGACLGAGFRSVWAQINIFHSNLLSNHWRPKLMGAATPVAWPVATLEKVYHFENLRI